MGCGARGGKAGGDAGLEARPRPSPDVFEGARPDPAAPELERPATVALTPEPPPRRSNRQEAAAARVAPASAASAAIADDDRMRPCESGYTVADTRLDMCLLPSCVP